MTIIVGLVLEVGIMQNLLVIRLFVEVRVFACALVVQMKEKCSHIAQFKKQS